MTEFVLRVSLSLPFARAIGPGRIVEIGSTVHNSKGVPR